MSSPSAAESTCLSAARARSRSPSRRAATGRPRDAPLARRSSEAIPRDGGARLRAYSMSDAPMKYILDTARLRLRQLELTDVDFVAQMLGNPDVTRFYSSQ